MTLSIAWRASASADLGQMQIDHRGLQAAVAEILLDDFQRDTRFEKMGRVGMSQRVDTDFFAKVDLVDDLLHRFLHGALGHRVLAVAILLVVTTFGGEQQPRMSMGDPIFSAASAAWMMGSGT